MIPLFKVHMSDRAVKASSEILSSGYIGQGPVVDKFENELSRYLELHKRHLITTNSATAAEHMSLHMLKHPGIYQKYIQSLVEQLSVNGMVWMMEMKYCVHH